MMMMMIFFEKFVPERDASLFFFLDTPLYVDILLLFLYTTTRFLELCFFSLLDFDHLVI